MPSPGGGAGDFDEYLQQQSQADARGAGPRGPPAVSARKAALRRQASDRGQQRASTPASDRRRENPAAADSSASAERPASRGTDPGQVGAPPERQAAPQQYYMAPGGAPPPGPAWMMPGAAGAHPGYHMVAPYGVPHPDGDGQAPALVPLMPPGTPGAPLQLPPGYALMPPAALSPCGQPRGAVAPTYLVPMPYPHPVVAGAHYVSYPAQQQVPPPPQRHQQQQHQQPQPQHTPPRQQQRAQTPPPQPRAEVLPQTPPSARRSLDRSYDDWNSDTYGVCSPPRAATPPATGASHRAALGQQWSPPRAAQQPPQHALAADASECSVDGRRTPPRPAPARQAPAPPGSRDPPQRQALQRSNPPHGLGAEQPPQRPAAGSPRTRGPRLMSPQRERLRAVLIGHRVRCKWRGQGAKMRQQLHDVQAMIDEAEGGSDDIPSFLQPEVLRKQRDRQRRELFSYMTNDAVQEAFHSVPQQDHSTRRVAPPRRTMAEFARGKAARDAAQQPRPTTPLQSSRRSPPRAGRQPAPAPAAAPAAAAPPAAAAWSWEDQPVGGGGGGRMARGGGGGGGVAVEVLVPERRARPPGAAAQRPAAAPAPAPAAAPWEDQPAVSRSAAPAAPEGDAASGSGSSRKQPRPFLRRGSRCPRTYVASGRSPGQESPVQHPAQAQPASEVAPPPELPAAPQPRPQQQQQQREQQQPTQAHEAPSSEARPAASRSRQPAPRPAPAAGGAESPDLAPRQRPPGHCTDPHTSPRRRPGTPTSACAQRSGAAGEPRRRSGEYRGTFIGMQGSPGGGHLPSSHPPPTAHYQQPQQQQPPAAHYQQRSEPPPPAPAPAAPPAPPQRPRLPAVDLERLLRVWGSPSPDLVTNTFPYELPEQDAKTRIPRLTPSSNFFSNYDTKFYHTIKASLQL